MLHASMQIYEFQVKILIVDLLFVPQKLEDHELKNNKTKFDTKLFYDSLAIIYLQLNLNVLTIS